MIALKPLPASLDVVKFAQARAFEIDAMERTMRTTKDAASSRAWQSLPRHLRRRAASHNIRRVPARLRERARKEMDPVKKKRLNALIAKAGKSKHQTRSEKFQARQLNKRWLETHIWHAKRMKMENKWGYRLSLHPTEKAFRPSHRAAVHGCILHDSSYIGTLEIKASQEILKRLIYKVCNPQGISAAAARYTNGSRACSTELYESSKYPLGFIAPAKILWMPLEDKTASQQPQGTKVQDIGSGQRTLWIRIHPSAYDMASKNVTNTVMEILESERKAGNPSVSVEIADLRSHLVSFDLVGPKSSQVIHGAFGLDGTQKAAIKKQFWSALGKLVTPASCPRDLVAGLQVHDPRLKFPPKNTSVKEGENNLPMDIFTINPSASLASSSLWSEPVRSRLAKPTFKKKDLDERRAKQLIPGTPLTPLRQDDRIPIILVQGSNEVSPAPGVNQNSASAVHGWTLLAPQGWGMALLSSLVFTGTRVGGLREVKSQWFESGLPYFPDDFSGTILGTDNQRSVGKEAEAKWSRTPPAKRTSFTTLGTRSPFQPDWNVVCGLVQPVERSEGFEPTQRMEEDQVDPWLLHGQGTHEIVLELVGVVDPATTMIQLLDAARQSRGLTPLTTDPQVLYCSGLVLVKITMQGRGIPSDMSMIYDVSDKELESWENGVSERTFQGPAPADEIIGYVTTGRPSLVRGCGMGIGAVALSRVVRSMSRVSHKTLQGHLVKIREAHGEVYWPALLDVI
ncbi:hypothetical protein PIIN_01645 [Serendipita indica DSM 11827]|uniref:POP1-domain-containing protein n=1 Tax=Serendipita indica (strain DSM 11827) TaxID=1109443 RepID=G4T912_SERID|nr:hypothetical protein PIIN_01645 [Serendipita indica DSM 11827]